METKVYVITTEEMIDGVIKFRFKIFSKPEVARKYFNDEIKEFEKDSVRERHYDKSDITNAEKSRDSYFAQSSCDEYYFQLNYNEEEIID